MMRKLSLSVAVVGAMTLAVACKGGATSGDRPAPGTTPVAAESTPSLPAEPVRVEVNDHGFQPSRVVLNFGRQVVFRRISENTCATAVVFPDLGIEKPLPLNTDVPVDLPASAHGEITFQCGMGMYKSKVVAR